MHIDDLLKVAAQSGASDLHLKVGSYPMMRVNGTLAVCSEEKRLDKGDTEGMAEFLARSGHEKDSNLWLVAQAVSEILPDGDKEKQLMQGLLNQKEQLDQLASDKGLF